MAKPLYRLRLTKIYNYHSIRIEYQRHLTLVQIQLKTNRREKHSPVSGGGTKNGLLNNAAQIYTPRCSVMDFPCSIVYARDCLLCALLLFGRLADGTLVHLSSFILSSTSVSEAVSPFFLDGQLYIPLQKAPSSCTV